PLTGLPPAVSVPLERARALAASQEGYRAAYLAIFATITGVVLPDDDPTIPEARRASGPLLAVTLDRMALYTDPALTDEIATFDLAPLTPVPVQRDPEALAALAV